MWPKAARRETLTSVRICPRCGEENSARFRLCGFCGAALTPAAVPEEVRKIVTIVFSDLKDSTLLGERRRGDRR